MTTETKAESNRDRARFGLVLALSFMLVLTILATTNMSGKVADIVVVGLSSLLLVVTAWLAHVTRTTMIVVLVIAGGLFLGSATATIFNANDSQARIPVLIAGLWVPALLIRALARRRTVDVHLLLGALSIYLMIGVTFATCYALEAKYNEANGLPPILMNNGTPTNGTYPDQLYYSFVTLSTTGYGDYTPVAGIARSLAIFEAIGGQLYLLTAVAAIVGLLTANAAKRPADERIVLRQRKLPGDPPETTT